MKVSPFSKSDEAFLTTFLSSSLRPEGTMSYAAFRGYLFGLSAGPAMVQPSAWMPGVFADESAGYADLDEARAVLGVMMSAYALSRPSPPHSTLNKDEGLPPPGSGGRP